MNIQLLKDSKVDVEKGVARCMNDVGLYERILKIFLRDDSFVKSEAAVESGDNKSLFESLHTLKGMSGNAELCGLYSAVCPLVELLRNGKCGSDEINSLFAAVRSEYNAVYEAIKAATAD